tara:strand:+ start:366 stop:1148 length:783 start_codon:yes stop_codon:yes gene_type:complete
MSKSNQEVVVAEATSPIELSQKEKDENFRIRTEIEVIFILRGIMKKNTLITLYYGDGNNFILTSILAIDVDKNEMVIDYGIEEKLNQIALLAPKLTFVTSQERIKVEFTCNTIRKIQFDGLDAFAVNIPESLVRMQRRNYFRISTPTVKPLKCIIPLPEENETRTAEVTLLDISCGGIGVIDHHPIISFDPGTIYKHCQIELPEIGTIDTTIQVKNTYEVTLRNGLACKRAGCAFLTLPVKMQAMIQRYIVKQERMQKID